MGRGLPVASGSFAGLYHACFVTGAKVECARMSQARLSRYRAAEAGTSQVLGRRSSRFEHRPSALC